MPPLLAPLVPALIILLGLAPIVVLVYWWRRKNRLYARQSPLTRNLLRPPGHSLRLKVEGFDSQIGLHLMAITVVPTMIFAAHVSQSYYGRVPESALRTGVLAAMFVAFIAVVGKRLLRLVDQRRLFALGLDGELATAEELNQLMRDGCRVFHDVPIQYGNVDHVVVSPSGVYAVNTKMLGKRPKGNDNAEVTVDHFTNIIQFPDRPYHIQVDKLKMEAKCLSRWLTSAIGAKKEVVVEPMLALPGWFIREADRPRGGICHQSRQPAAVLHPAESPMPVRRNDSADRPPA